LTFWRFTNRIIIIIIIRHEVFNSLLQPKSQVGKVAFGRGQFRYIHFRYIQNIGTVGRSMFGTKIRCFAPKPCHITPSLRCLRWLKITKICDYSKIKLELDASVNASHSTDDIAEES